MKNFRRFNPGEPIAASRLNELVDYSGVAQSSVPNTPGTYFGSRRANAETSYDSNLIFLVYATENFEKRITDHTTEDDVPSGLCDFVDLKRATNTHVPQEDGRAFYVHDPVAGATESASKKENDVFHIVFNKQSKRWEVLAGGGSNLEKGIVVARRGCGYYDIEKVNWSGVTPEEPDEEEPNECDICENLIAGAGGVCENGQTLPVFTEADPTHRIVTRQSERNAEEDRVVVLAFHRQSIFVPLAMWSECLLQNNGDTNVVGNDDPVPVYQIVDGFQEHGVFYTFRKDCCNGVDTVMYRTPHVIPSHACPEETCTECEEE